jgi:hypothetical protein
VPSDYVSSWFQTRPNQSHLSCCEVAEEKRSLRYVKKDQEQEETRRIKEKQSTREDGVGEECKCTIEELDRGQNEERKRKEEKKKKKNNKRPKSTFCCTSKAVALIAPSSFDSEP